MSVVDIAENVILIGFNNNFWSSTSKCTEHAAVVPIPTVRFGCTFNLIVSLFFNPCTSVDPAATFVVIVVTTRSTLPVTFL